MSYQRFILIVNLINIGRKIRQEPECTWQSPILAWKSMREKDSAVKRLADITLRGETEKCGEQNM